MPQYDMDTKESGILQIYRTVSAASEQTHSMNFCHPVLSRPFLYRSDSAWDPGQQKVSGNHNLQVSGRTGIL